VISVYRDRPFSKYTKFRAPSSPTPVILAGKVDLIFYRCVTVQNGGSITFNLQFPQGEPVNSNGRNMIMNKNQVKGVAKDIAGKVQEEAGKLVGSKEQQVKGLGKQISGKAEKVYGDAKEVVKDANKHS